MSSQPLDEKGVNRAMSVAWPLLMLLLIALVLKALWIGDSSSSHLKKARSDLQQQENIITQAQQRNALVQAEITDLQDGLEMIEERARLDLGMVKQDEIRVVVR